MCVSGSAVEPSTVNSSPTWRNIDPSRDSASKTPTHTRTSAAPCEHTITKMTQPYMDILYPPNKYSQVSNHTSLVSPSQTLKQTSVTWELWLFYMSKVYVLEPVCVQVCNDFHHFKEYIFLARLLHNIVYSEEKKCCAEIICWSLWITEIF